MAKIRIQPHVRLQEWVAEEHGYFRDEGLDYEFDPAGFAAARRTPTSTVSPSDAAPLAVRSGAFEDMQAGRTCDVSGACHWAVNAAATAEPRADVGPRVLGVPVRASSSRPTRRIRSPRTWPASRSASATTRAATTRPSRGSSRSSTATQIELDFVGRPVRPRPAHAATGDIPAANVFGAQYYLLEQLGFRKLVDTTFMMGFLVAEDADRRHRRATSARCGAPSATSTSSPSATSTTGCARCPTTCSDVVDVRRFGPGERIVFEPYTREMFERTHRWMEAWDLFDAGAVARPAYEDAVIA